MEILHSSSFIYSAPSDLKSVCKLVCLCVRAASFAIGQLKWILVHNNHHYCVIIAIITIAAARIINISNSGATQTIRGENN